FRLCRHGFLTLIRQCLAEPSDAPRDNQNGAECAHCNACQQSCEEEGKTESQNDRPRGRSGKLDSCGHVCSWRIHALFHLPTMYTTVKTAIQTASTKCQ